MIELINQISFLSTWLYIIGITSLLQKPGSSSIGIGTIIVFSASIINFSTFSNFDFLSVEGQVIGLLLVFILLLHLFIQKILFAPND